MREKKINNLALIYNSDVTEPRSRTAQFFAFRNVANVERFPFDEIFEISDGNRMEQDLFRKRFSKIEDNLFSVPEKWKFQYFRKFSCSIQKLPVGTFEHIR